MPGQKAIVNTLTIDTITKQLSWKSIKKIIKKLGIFLTCEFSKHTFIGPKTYQYNYQEIDCSTI